MEVLLELAGDMLHGAVVLHMLMCGCMFNRMSVVCLFWWYSPRKKKINTFLKCGNNMQDGR